MKMSNVLQCDKIIESHKCKITKDKVVIEPNGVVVLSAISNINAGTIIAISISDQEVNKSLIIMNPIFISDKNIEPIIRNVSDKNVTIDIKTICRFNIIAGQSDTNMSMPIVHQLVSKHDTMKPIEAPHITKSKFEKPSPTQIDDDFSLPKHHKKKP